MVYACTRMCVCVCARVCMLHLLSFFFSIVEHNYNSWRALVEGKSDPGKLWLP